jgi:hypothetical protein
VERLAGHVIGLSQFVEGEHPVLDRPLRQDLGPLLGLASDHPDFEPIHWALRRPTSRSRKNSSTRPDAAEKDRENELPRMKAGTQDWLSLDS